MDIERTMQFILDQQAQFSVQQERIAKQHAELSAHFSEYQVRVASDFVRINAVLVDVATAQERANAIVAVLAERQVLTEQSLNALISTVERHIANHD